LFRYPFSAFTIIIAFVGFCLVSWHIVVLWQ
jgi:hypothetical protein